MPPGAKTSLRGRRLDADTLDFMFPCHFEIDRQLNICDPGRGLQRLVPEALAGRPLAGVFELESGEEFSSFTQVKTHIRRHVVLTLRRDRRLTMHGAMAPQAGGRILFLLSPKIGDTATAKSLGIDFSALSPCDGSAELMVAAEMLRLMTAEANEYAERLSFARDAAVGKQAFFNSILKLLPSLVLVKDANDGRYLLVNKMAEEIIGIPAEEMLGKTVFDLFPPAEAAKFAQEDAEVLSTGETKVQNEEAITTRTLGSRHFITKKLAISSDDGGRYLVCIGEDITERHQAESTVRQALAIAEQASLSKSRFLANMSHEIRTPLNGIVAVADVLSRAALDPKEHELVEIIQASGGTLERLLSDILDMARIESNQIKIERCPFHLGDVARAAAALTRLRADEKGVAVEVVLDAKIDTIVLGDMVRVRQVLTNLLGNAVKFTLAGRICLTATHTDEGAVRFVVEDTGIGFDPETKARIFGRFQQADDTITRKFGGSGLGLAISRELVELMGGQLDCDSEPGRGSTFWFELPLQAGVLSDNAAARDGSVARPERLARVLVADDHPTNRKVVELMLQGYAEIVCVENGQEAVAAFQAENFDLVLMDMQMPVMDGLMAVRAIRTVEPSGSRTPIIMLTANSFPEHVAASMACGADLHLDKPITARTLFSAMETVFERVATGLSNKDASLAASV